MTIFQDEVEKEQVDLFALKTKEELHRVFQEKGFKRKNNETIQEDLRIQNVETQLAMEEQLKPMFSKVFMMYGVVGFVTLVVAFTVRIRRKKQRRMLLPARS